MEFKTTCLPSCRWHLLHMPSQLHMTLFYTGWVDSFYYIFIAPPSIQACIDCPPMSAYMFAWCVELIACILWAIFVLTSNEGQALIIDQNVPCWEKSTASWFNVLTQYGPQIMSFLLLCFILFWCDHQFLFIHPTYLPIFLKTASLAIEQLLHALQWS